MVHHPLVAGFAPSALLVACALAAPPAIANPAPFTHVSIARDMRALPPHATAPYSRATVPPRSTTADGVWQEFNLLQVNLPLAAYDQAQDRLLSLSGWGGMYFIRRGNWTLPLAGPREWQPLPAPPPAEDFEARTSTYDPSSGLVYFIAWGSTGLIEIHRLVPATGVVAAIAASGGPPGEPVSAPVFDPVNQRVLVYVMGINDPYPTDPHVWALDLLPAPTWSQWIPSGTPPPLQLAYLGSFASLDPVRRRMVFPTCVYGDSVSGPLSIWTLTLDGPPEWLHFETNGLPDGTQSPGPVAYDAEGDRLLAIGAQGDPYALSLKTYQWSQVPVAGPGPSPRGGAGVAFDSAHRRLLVSGGATPSGDDTHSDTWSLTLDGLPDWTQLVPDATRPPIRGGASDGLDTSRRRLVVFGGSDVLGGFRNDTWVLDLDAVPAWSPLATQGPPPPGRYWHASTWDPARDQLVVFGGYNGDSSHPLGDLWTLSFAGGTPTWSPVTPTGPAPVPRMLSRLVYDSARDRFLLLFGYYGVDGLNDVWELRLSPAPAWRRLTPSGAPPIARAAEMCVYDVARDRVLVFGGGTQNEYLNDLWALNLGSGDGMWQQLSVPAGPSGRNLGLLQLDAVHNRLLLFGGYGISHVEPGYTYIDYLNDAWALDLAGTPAWRQLSPAGFVPAGRDRANGAYDALHDRLVLACGGISGSNDVWAFAFGDGPTPTLLDLASRDVAADRVKLVWWGEESGLVVTAYRREPGADWRSLGTLLADGSGYVTLVDRDVTPGATYEYRLGVTSDGVESFFGMTRVEIPRLALALSARAAGGRVSFTVQLPTGEPATLALFDVAGRSAWSTAVGHLGAGSHEVNAGAASLPPAIYFARLTQGQAMRLARFAIVR